MNAIPIRDVPRVVTEICGRRVSLASVYKWFGEGLKGGRKLKTRLVGGRRYCDKAELEKFLLNGTDEVIGSKPYWDAKDEQLIEIYKMVSKKGRIPLKDLLGRELVVTPSCARYGMVSHWILSINGSPPRGTILFDCERIFPKRCWLIVGINFVTLKNRDYATVEKFLQRMSNAEDRNLPTT